MPKKDRRTPFVLVMLPALLAVICQTAVAMEGEGESANVLACRLANYHKFQDAAWTHLPTIGFKYVFLNVPSPDQVEVVKGRLAEHGLSAAVMRGNADLSNASCVDEMAAQLETCEKMGVKYMFLSPKHPGIGKEVAYERLRQMGRIAERHGVTITLETHPDLGVNGDAHVETMKRIDHPNVRINFDTGNITYYNRGTDAVTELKKCIDYVATIEFKDHNGQFEAWNFPVIGKGVVDFPAIVEILRCHNYSGPITMEVEGIRGLPMDKALTKKYIELSAAYIRSLDIGKTGD